MRGRVLVGLCLAWLSAGCGQPGRTERSYTLQGQVLAVDENRRQATVKHEDIKGFMPAMTMPYRVGDPKLLDGIQPGDLITARLVVTNNDAFLGSLTKVGSAPLDEAAVSRLPSAAATPLAPGKPVPNARFTDQQGRARDFESFKGSPVVLTFIYTRCPIPTFCPLMDRQFLELQQAITTNPTFKTVRLLSISFDPDDTPAVLLTHAQKVGANPAVWTFVGGPKDEIDRFGATFGLTVIRQPNNPADITHSLRTAIVDASGTLVRTYTGNDWTPTQLLADLAPVARTR